jgi:hypothetical protein
MTDIDKLKAVLDEMSAITKDIGRLLNELKPVAASLMQGNRDPALLYKNTQLQAKIDALHELREYVKRSL